MFLDGFIHYYPSLKRTITTESEFIRSLKVQLFFFFFRFLLFYIAVRENLRALYLGIISQHELMTVIGSLKSLINILQKRKINKSTH